MLTRLTTFHHVDVIWVHIAFALVFVIVVRRDRLDAVNRALKVLQQERVVVL